jgi:hypothetical protein
LNKPIECHLLFLSFDAGYRFFSHHQKADGVKKAY